MWNVVPEALLDYQSYLQWTRDITGSTPAHFVPENEGEFDEMSKQAWTHVLMQIIKVHMFTYMYVNIHPCSLLTQVFLISGGCTPPSNKVHSSLLEK